jgi:hypothetical protein
MSSLDFDLDTSKSRVESEWRLAYESLIIARAEYQALAANPEANADLLDLAHERLYQAEAMKARVMAGIDGDEVSAGFGASSEYPTADTHRPAATAARSSETAHP